MTNRTRTLSSLATLALATGMISWSGTLHAQTTPSSQPDQQPQSQQQPAPDAAPSQQPQTQPTPSPDTPSAQQPAQPAPDAQAPSSQTPSAAAPGAASKTPTSDSQVFSGTVEKQGDKYVLKDDSGTTYDIDHQDEVKKFEGKRVRVQGTLDETGKKIKVK